MSDSSNSVLIDFNSPIRKASDLHTPLVPAPKLDTVIGLNVGIGTINNPFDLVIDQITADSQSDPFEAVFKAAFTCNTVDTPDAGVPGGNDPASTVVAMRDILSLASGRDKLIMDESCSCIESAMSVTDSLENSADDVEEQERLGILVEHELNRAMDRIGSCDQPEEAPLSRTYSIDSDDDGGIPNMISPSKEDMKMLIANQIEKCIQRGLDDSKTEKPDPRKHRRSHSSSMFEGDPQRANGPCISSSFSEASSKACRRFSNSLKNLSTSAVDSDLLERYRALKSSMQCSTPVKGSQPPPSPPFNVSYGCEPHQAEDIGDTYRHLKNFRRSFDLAFSSKYAGESAEAAYTYSKGRRRSCDVAYAPRDVSVNGGCPVAATDKRTGFAFRKSFDLCALSSLQDTPATPGPLAHAAVSSAKDELALSFCQDKDDSVFLEAKSIASMLMHKADGYQMFDQESSDDDDILCDKWRMPEIPDSDLDLEEQDVCRLSSSLQEQKQPALTSVLVHTSFDGASQCVEQKRMVLRRSISTGSTAVANSIPAISKDNISGLGLVSHTLMSLASKNHLPLLVPPPPVPLVDSTGKAEKVKPLKSLQNPQLVKKGPLKAVLPVGNMMRSVLKLHQQGEAVGAATGKAREKKMEQASTVKLQPVAESTPAANRKSGHMVRISKMYSPIPHAKSDPSLVGKKPPPVQRRSSVAGDLPSVNATSTTVQLVKTEDKNHPRSKSLDCSGPLKLPMLKKSVRNEKAVPKQASSVQNTPEARGQRRVKSTSSLQNKKAEPGKQHTVKKGSPQQASTPLRALAKNSHINRLLGTRTVKQAFSGLMRGSATGGKENVTP